MPTRWFNVNPSVRAIPCYEKAYPESSGRGCRNGSIVTCVNGGTNISNGYRAFWKRPNPINGNGHVLLTIGRNIRTHVLLFYCDTANNISRTSVVCVYCSVISGSSGLITENRSARINRMSHVAASIIRVSYQRQRAKLQATRGGFIRTIHILS